MALSEREPNDFGTHPPQDSESFFQHVLNSVSAHVAIIDQHGWIVVVNDAWNRFARENGAPDLRSVGVGVNYLEICRRAAEDVVGARDALYGISSVLEGLLDRFALEYACHNPRTGQQFWFLLNATPLRGEGGGAVLTHIDITARKVAEHEREQLLSQLQYVLSNQALLGRLIPVCSRCRNPLQDENFWRQLWDYVQTHAELEFGQALCPECQSSAQSAPPSNQPLNQA